MGVGMAAHLLQLFLVTGMLAGASTVPSSWQADGSKEESQTSKLPSEALHDEDTTTRSAFTSNVIKLSNGTEMELFPASKRIYKHVNGTQRRKLGDFRQCSPCTCCDRSRRWCLPTVCCYNIRCGVRGLPFGLCSFIPISCTCFGCRS